MSARNKGRLGRSIPIQAVSFESLAADYPIGFPPPLAEHSANPEAFDFNWHLIQFVFNLPDPRSFPPMARPIPEDAAMVLRRYRDVAIDLAESAFLAHPTKVTVSMLGDDLDEQVEKSFPPKENIRGFSVLFRQFYSNEEAASFNGVQGTLRRLNNGVADDAVSMRNEQLTAWNRAAGKLRGFPLKLLVGKRLQEQGQLPAGPLPNEHLPAPEMLISIYSYGDDIHWGRQREQVAAYGKSTFDSAWTRMACFEAMVGLAYVYLGFAQIVDAALRDHNAATADS